MTVFDTEARTLLASEQRRLREAIDVLASHDPHPFGDPRPDEHPADAASDTFEREVEVGLHHVLRAELAEIELALVRLDAGRYGTCEACGRPIPDDRLRAVPATRLCLADQCVAEDDDGALHRASIHGPVEQEAIENLDLLPTDDQRPAVEAAEEAALHVATQP